MTREASVDPEYSVLGLSSGPCRNGAQYLDIVTGWQGSDRTWRGDVVKCRPVRPESPLFRTGVL